MAPTNSNSSSPIPRCWILSERADDRDADRFCHTYYQRPFSDGSPHALHNAGAISLERQLPHNFKVSATYSHARSLHLLRTRAINAPLPGTFNPLLPKSGVRPFGSANNIFQYESTGRFDQNLLTFNVVNSFSRRGSVTINYTFAKAKSDTDGTGSFPANSYDLSGEYGRASNDIRHRLTVVGSYRGPWGLSFNPFVIVTSGAPFNITIGRDLNGDTLFIERPAFATDQQSPA